jgi:hypothetical protein
LRQFLTFGCVAALAFAVMSFTQIVKTPAGFAVAKEGSAFAADLGRPLPPPPPPPPPVGKGKAPVLGKSKAPIVTRG